MWVDTKTATGSQVRPFSAPGNSGLARFGRPFRQTCVNCVEGLGFPCIQGANRSHSISLEMDPLSVGYRLGRSVGVFKRYPGVDDVEREEPIDVDDGPFDARRGACAWLGRHPRGLRAQRAPRR